MPLDAHQRRRIAEHCWLVYDLISRHFRPAPDFHLEFPEAVELEDFLARAAALIGH